MATKLNGTIYAHADGTLVVTPLEGVNEGVPFELRKVKSFEWDLAAGSSQVEGFAVAPEGLAPTAAKPNWTAELDAVAEAMALALHLGPGAVTLKCSVTYTMQRSGLPTTTVDVTETLITKGLGGGKSDSGSKPTGSIGGNCTNILLNGVDLLTRPAT